MKRARIAPLAATLAAFSMLLTGCGQAGTPNGDDKASDTLTIGVSNLGLSAPFPASIGEGIKARADKLGVKIIQVDGQSKTEKQANDVQDLIGQKVDGILLLPVDSGVATSLVDQIVGAKIPVAAVASQVGDPKTRDLTDVYPGLLALITQQEEDASAEAGKLALKAVPAGGKLAVVEGAAGFAEVQLRFAKFLDAADEAGVKFDVVARQPGDWTVEKAQSACQNMLASKPDIDLFYAQSDDMAVGCADAVRAAGSKAQVVGIGGSKLGIDGVNNKKIYGTVCYKPFDLGELAMQTMYDNLTGKNTKTEQFVSYHTPPIDASNTSECDPQW